MTIALGNKEMKYEKEKRENTLKQNKTTPP